MYCQHNILIMFHSISVMAPAQDNGQGHMVSVPTSLAGPKIGCSYDDHIWPTMSHLLSTCLCHSLIGGVRHSMDRRWGGSHHISMPGSHNHSTRWYANERLINKPDKHKQGLFYYDMLRQTTDINLTH